MALVAGVAGLYIYPHVQRNPAMEEEARDLIRRVAARLGVDAPSPAWDESGYVSLRGPDVTPEKLREAVKAESKGGEPLLYLPPPSSPIIDFAPPGI